MKKINELKYDILHAVSNSRKESYHKKDKDRLTEGILTNGKNAISCFDFPKSF